MGFAGEWLKKVIPRLLGAGMETSVPSGGFGGAFVHDLADTIISEIFRYMESKNISMAQSRRMEELLGRGDFEEAVQFLTAIMAQDPRNPWPYYTRSLVYLIKSLRSNPPWDHVSIERADKDMAEARRLKPGDKQIGHVYGYIYVSYLLASAQDYKKKTNIDRAFMDVIQILRRMEGFEEELAGRVARDGIDHRIRGFKYLDSGDHERALAAGEQLLGLNAKDVSGLYIRGRALLAKKEFDRGVNDLLKAHRISPDSQVLGEALSAAYVRRAFAKLDEKDGYGSARADFLEAQRLGNKDASEAIESMDFIKKVADRKHR
jgi:tetratricopeptide (TPR) repeat protein